jgi:hypothetical protein
MHIEAHNAILMVGGPDAGKTNFIGRLWLSIDDGSGVLSKNGNPKDPKDLTYLQELANQLLSGQFIRHTSRDAPPHLNEIPITCRLGTEASNGSLIVPDCSGEQWHEIYKKREWSDYWERLISGVKGCLLFVRATSDQFVPMLDGYTYQSLFGSDTSSLSEISDQPTTPTEIMLIDWIQILLRALTDSIGAKILPRMGIVVTAWDLVPTDQRELGAEAYVRSNFPMLMHFLEANTHRLQFSTFGISIAGGDLENNQIFHDEYLVKGPLQCGYVYHNLNKVVEKSPDVALPIVWALGLRR